MISLANLGNLSGFVGMLTDSRSFLSYTRHDYFRRILCNLIGGWVENGEFPADYDTLEEIVKGICFNNLIFSVLDSYIKIFVMRTERRRKGFLWNFVLQHLQEMSNITQPNV